MISGGESGIAGPERPSIEGMNETTTLSESTWHSLESALDGRSGWLVGVRRELHARPEPSGGEVETTARLAGLLRDAGFEPRVMQGDVGVIADLDLGASGGTRVALRADIDCVAVPDHKPVDYRSARAGLCHACGHDVHSTVLLATAIGLRERRDELEQLGLRHDLRFIFQPAEETATGARSMIEQGAIRDVAAIAALHADPTIPVGRIGIRRGAMTAAAKLFRITVTGRGGHSARPHEAIDPIPAAAALVSQFYQLCPRSMDSRYPLAITVGSLNAGTAYNAIPDEASLRGTLRAVRPEDMGAVASRMEAIVEGVSRSTGCDMRLEFIHHAPETRNDPALVDAVCWAASEALGPEAVTWLEAPSMGGEDFAFYQQEIPGVFFRLGAALSDGRPMQPLHSPLFDVDESAIGAGARVMLHLAIHLASAYEPERRA